MSFPGSTELSLWNQGDVTGPTVIELHSNITVGSGAAVSPAELLAGRVYWYRTSGAVVYRQVSLQFVTTTAAGSPGLEIPASTELVNPLYLTDTEAADHGVRIVLNFSADVFEYPGDWRDPGFVPPCLLILFGSGACLTPGPPVLSDRIGEAGPAGSIQALAYGPAAQLGLTCIPNPVVRGDTIRCQATGVSPANVTAWEFASPRLASTIVRAANETQDTAWVGQMVMSGRITVRAMIASNSDSVSVDVGVGRPPVFRFDRWTSEDGLPSQFVSDLAQTGDGYLWAVVARRLVRFDGRRMTVFYPGQTEGLPNDDLIGLGAGSGDTLWIVTETGQLVSRAAGRFAVRAGAGRKLSDVATDRSGRLWVWNNDDVFRVTDTAFQRVAPGAQYLPQVGEIRPNVAPTPAGGVWVAGETLRSFDSTGRAITVGPAQFNVVVDNRDGSPIVARPVGAEIALFRPTGEPIGSVPSAGDRIPRLVDRAGRIWTTRAGFVEGWQPGTAAPVATVPLGTGVRVRMMIEDREGNVWVGTATEGLVRIQEVPFTHIGRNEGLLERQVLRVARGPGNGAIAVDQTGNVYRITNGRAEVVYAATPPTGVLGGPGARFATAAFEDARGTLWLATVVTGEGPQLIGRTSGGPTVRVQLEPFDAVHAMVADPRDPDVLWLTGNGVIKVRAYGPGGGVIEQRYLHRGWTARELVADGTGGMWALSRDSVARIDQQGVTGIPFSDPAGAHQLRALFPVGGGAVLVGTYGAGIARIGGPPHAPLTAAAGLGENIVSRIVADDAGNLWMAGDRSVHRVPLVEVTAWFADSIRQVTGVRYGRLAGIPNPEGSGGAAYRGPDGRIWFPTFDGIALVDPAAALRLDRDPPVVRIEGITVDRRVAAPADTARLRRGSTTVAIAFSAISLRDPGGVMAEYRLVGRDTAWTPAGDLREIQYGVLPGGTYRFEVRARSAGGVSSPSGSRLTIVVPSLFRDTAAFYLLLLGGLAATAWGAARLRSRRLMARQALLQQTVEERTRDLQHQQHRTEEALNTIAWQAEQLRALDQARTTFFSNVTHELRTPLTLILGPLQDLAEGRRGRLPDSAKEDVGLVRQNAERLQQLVDQLLDLAKMEAGSMPLRAVQVDVTDFFHRVAGPFEAHARSAGKGFRLELELGGPDVWLDPDCMEKILTNLLGNAFNYTPEGGRVSLSARIEDGAGTNQLAVSVADTGKGIPPDQLERVFDRFHRVEERRRAAPAGSGLGLALVKELVSLHGGTISVASEVGLGTEFTVRIPVVGPNGGTAAAPVLESAPTDQPTVIVVEDHPDMRAFIRRHLEIHYRVLEAGDGREGLDLARAIVPDAIVSDVMMPGMNGEELCQAVKTDPDLDFIPVILLTAKSSHESRLAGLRHGADAYLTKPFDAEELRLTIRNAVDARRRLRERFRDAGRSLPVAPAPARPAGTGQEADRFVERLHQVLSARVGDENLDVEELAKALVMSRSTFYRRVQESLGRPPMEVIWEFRLEQAATWLTGTDATVAEVAYGVGFKSVPHFTRRFRERFGATPAAYRRT